MDDMWKPIDGFAGYSVSRDGRVRSSRKQMRGSISDKGYHIVTLRNAERRLIARVHRLVASAFLEPGHTTETVNHKNGVKIDNRVSNLEWATRAENVWHAIRHGLGDYAPPRLYGADHPKHKLSEEQVVLASALIAQGNSLRSVARQFGVNHKSLSKRLPKPPVGAA